MYVKGLKNMNQSKLFNCKIFLYAIRSVVRNFTCIDLNTHEGFSIHKDPSVLRLNENSSEIEIYLPYFTELSFSNIIFDHSDVFGPPLHGCKKSVTAEVGVLPSKHIQIAMSTA